jgi:acetyl-CoA carboxylase carboxyl transferase subunit beta
MGSIVGKKITCLIKYALKKSMSLVIVCSTIGARMHETTLSLMQMAKISSILQIQCFLPMNLSK